MLEINASAAAKKVKGNKNFMLAACSIDVVVSDFQAVELSAMIAKTEVAKAVLVLSFLCFIFVFCQIAMSVQHCESVRLGWGDRKSTRLNSSHP